MSDFEVPEFFKETYRLQERERIIKLLETYYKPEDTKTLCFINHEQYLDLIALIKGEQK